MGTEYSIDHECVCHLNSTNAILWIGDFHLCSVSNLLGQEDFSTRRQKRNFMSLSIILFLLNLDGSHCEQDLSVLTICT